MWNISHRVAENYLNKYRQEENAVYNQSSLHSNRHICVLIQILKFFNTISTNTLGY
jgi:hypothetical protein